MHQIPQLITDLSFILMTAGLSLLLFRAIKQPIVLGYILSGFLLGPHFPLFPTVRDTTNLQAWAEIGVIFLLFSIGLEFSYKKLAIVGKNAFSVAAIKVLFLILVGYFIGILFNWSEANSLFLGCLLSISSTAIVARTFEDLNYKKNSDVDFIFGILIIEDLFAILLLVFLSTYAVTQSFSGRELGITMLQLAMFLVITFLVGLYLVPRFIKKVKPILTDETVLVLMAGACLMMVLISHKVGFSPALGAFILGSLLSETVIFHQVEKVFVSIKYLFSAIFFVSIGMLLDPKVLVQYWPYILTISVLTMIAKMISTFLGAVLAGKDLPTSFRAGLTLAQIGEFSFIIATLGSELNVTSDFLYPIAISVSVITSFATPYLVMNSDPIYQWLLPRIPQKFLNSMQNYSQAINDRRSSKNFIYIFFEMYGLKIIINSIIIVSITLFFAHFVLPEMKNRFTSRFQMELIMLSGTLLLCLPFFGPILFGRPSKSLSKMQLSIDRAKAYHLGIILCRCLVALFLILFIIGQFSALAAISSFLVLSLGLIYLPISRYAQWIYHYFENGFVENLKKEK